MSFRQPFPADFTFPSRIARVFYHVPRQIRFGVCPEITMVTTKAFVFNVNLLVPFQHEFVGESLVANVAAEGLLARVSRQVVGQTTTG